MSQHFRYTFSNLGGVANDARFRAWHQRTGGQPAWVWKLTGLIVLLVVLLPLVLLLLTVLLVGIVSYIVLSLVASVLKIFGIAQTPGTSAGAEFHVHREDASRENVRVMDGQ